MLKIMVPYEATEKHYFTRNKHYNVHYRVVKVGVKLQLILSHLFKLIEVKVLSFYFMNNN